MPLFKSMLEEFDKEINEANAAVCFQQVKLEEVTKHWEKCLKRKNNLLQLESNCEVALGQVKSLALAAQHLSCFSEFKQAFEVLLDADFFEAARPYKSFAVPKDIENKLTLFTVVIASNIVNQPRTKAWILKYNSMSFLSNPPELNKMCLADKHISEGWSIVYDSGKCLLRWEGETWKDFDKEWLVDAEFMPGTMMC
jgi:hypothetical protein